MTISIDSVHYNAIRKALANGNAAVMVGAGFSRNAENGDSLALWQDIAKELWRELNPQESKFTDYSPINMTQLGEQYARVFSKPALEEVLKRLIPDDRVRPGVLHEQLLKLPWSEIFTTNYDTLLERAAEDVIERAHCTVTCREDIPQSKILSRRRIVKLHGSFPSQRPFIFTEDDYRTYPEQFAPFVNLVRQSLLENVFCLIGFSGDDPNFLYWIGWVRDMLDQHSLPIYLLLSKQPTIGQKALLEARRVTPVVIPQPEGVKEDDYSSRLLEMLKILSIPLETEDSEWGKDQHIRYDRVIHDPSPKKRISNIIDSYGQISALHKSYPEWIIAPKKIRTRLIRIIDDLPEIPNTGAAYHYLTKEIPLVSVVIFSEYAWLQETSLQCLQDSIAVPAICLLIETKDFRPEDFNSQKENLEKLNVKDSIEFHRRWRTLGLSLLRWARQELRRSDFNILAETLKSSMPNDFYVSDEIYFESILLSLFEGDRDIALDLAESWAIRSTDSYMYIRKGMLLSELGKIISGYSIGLEGLKKIRQKQKMHIKNTKYISEEAWACIAIEHLQRVKEWEIDKDEDDLHNDALPIQLNRRLNDLAVSGHDPRREIETIISDLKEEVVFPLQTTSYSQGFALGRYSTTQHLAGSTDLNSKIEAAFAWQTLSDRICLTPRTGNSTYNIDSFARAAWWVQYADSMERVFSLVIRTLDKKLLEPRNPNQLPHKSGWLSRYQVARTEERLALNICQKSLSLVERIFKKTSEVIKQEKTISFHMEVISRLIIRIQDEPAINDLMKRIILLHQQDSLQKVPEIWKGFGNALCHCFEALPPQSRPSAVLEIVRLHDWSSTSELHFKGDWLPLQKLSPQQDSPRGSPDNPDAVSVIKKLLDALQSADTPTSEETERVWQRLFCLKSWGYISETDVQSIKDILLKINSWPILPNHYPWASITWLENEKDAEIEFKTWLFGLKIKPLSSTQSNPSGLRKSWSLSNEDVFLTNITQSFDHISWNEEEIELALSIVKDWLDSEWPDITLELSNESLFNSFRSVISRRFSNIDLIFSKLYEVSTNTSLTNARNSARWIDPIAEESRTNGIYLWKYRISKSIKTFNTKELKLIETELIEHLLDADLSKNNSAASAIYFWFNFPDASEIVRPNFLIDTLAGIVAARRMPALPFGLNLMHGLALKDGLK